MQILGMFTKFWRPGSVKSRLAADTGNDVAAKVYHAFVSHLAGELGSSGEKRYFVVSPDADVEQPFFMHHCSWGTLPQGQGSLGERLERFFRRSSFGDKMIVIGGDCPSLSAKGISDAFQGLDQHEVVLGPSLDGGYYTLGVQGPWRAEYQQLFRNISWGTESVLQETVQRLESIDANYRLLDENRDIDTLDDLRQLLAELPSESTLRVSIESAMSR